MSHCGFFPEEEWDDHQKTVVALVINALEAAGHVAGERYIMFSGGPDQGPDGVWDMFNSNETVVTCSRCGKSLTHSHSWGARKYPEDEVSWGGDSTSCVVTD